MRHHAYVVVGDSEAGVKAALAHIERELGLKAARNPDVIVFRYGLLPVEEARRIISIAHQGAIGGEHKAVVIVASRIYHEAQNAFLKLFEEPPRSTTLYLIVPQIGQLLSTLRSRVAVLEESKKQVALPELATDFLRATREKRSAIIKKLTSGTDEEERRENRDEALALVSGIEQAVYSAWEGEPKLAALLSDIIVLRSHLYDRSAPLKMILEHLAIVTPQGLLAGRHGLAK
ncbi:hypothetical protein A3H77_01645 [Candidatus Kaiserbacteria bacterium RIFCSPLOWO2_02_FULL_56_11]|uniref:Uncharacterized protein n=2 Tax=Candidatus Kaiseribacteriota TaxID=1752734 RepID=A0A1F6E2N6_9BACT|nr:MAG: hypothetical protein A3C95_01260 [Candidatus Kaiserbacteria bacterium RIFCSPHIGHO2_02_FULL_56_30]OGG72250.1 MAG: hypothetical protein A3E65_01910 [Candidatus Kaiserbacteria bacterium RIFCSPHIGHO2_12_FULL_56_13]OGG81678.1 MAG: hypothetical protein A3H77_01645 [Candidatus Kaiserbacteria bacterium RIFCSPLOWO2_02_FULL_56_11]